ncbi:MAG: hypothetical protein ACLRQF_17460 [Thomasclavelia ramosa]
MGFNVYRFSICWTRIFRQRRVRKY